MDESKRSLIMQEFWAILNIPTSELAQKIGVSLVTADMIMNLIAVKFSVLKKESL